MMAAKGKRHEWRDEEIKLHPLVRAVLKAFPGAKIIAIRPLKKSTYTTG
jgi:hypothetical protein